MITRLRRYTNLASTIYLLQTRAVTLLDPESWEDRNDIYYLKKFKEQHNLKTLLALCFTDTNETFHHWKVFSPGSDGVCVEFNQEKLLKHIRDREGFLYDYVDYEKIRTVKREPPDLRDLPFLKRIPYRDEQEYRIIYTNDFDLCLTYDVAIDLECIRRITLSPWMPKLLSDSVKETLKSISGCDSLEITRSTLLDNSQWKNAIRR